MTTLTYTRARQNLAAVLNDVESTQEPAIIRRKGHEDVALIPAIELAGLLETAHLFRSPANASRLRAAIERSIRGETMPMDVAALRRQFLPEKPAASKAPRQTTTARKRAVAV